MMVVGAEGVTFLHVAVIDRYTKNPARPHAGERIAVASWIAERHCQVSLPTNLPRLLVDQFREMDKV